MKAEVKATVRFSYVFGGAKYDLVSLEGSPSPVVFKNSRLFAVLPHHGVHVGLARWPANYPAPPPSSC